MLALGVAGWEVVVLCWKVMHVARPSLGFGWAGQYLDIPQMILSYSEAGSLCREVEQGSDLPAVHSQAELSFLADLARQAGWLGPRHGIYLGGTLGTAPCMDVQ